MKGYSKNQETLFDHLLSINLSEPKKTIEQVKAELGQLGTGSTEGLEISSIPIDKFL